MRADEYSSLDKFIVEKKDLGLTHLFTDGSISRNDILNDVYFNEEDYPYLEKIFDSQDKKFDYHVKIFEINYTLLENSGL